VRLTHLCLRHRLSQALAEVGVWQQRARKLTDQASEREERLKKSRADVIHLEGVLRQAWQIFSIHRKNRPLPENLPSEADMADGLCLGDVPDRGMRLHWGADDEQMWRAIWGPASRPEQGDGDDAADRGGGAWQRGGSRHRGRAGKEKAGLKRDGGPGVGRSKRGGPGVEEGEISRGAQRASLDDLSPTSAGSSSDEPCGPPHPHNEVEQTATRRVQTTLQDRARSVTGEHGRAGADCGSEGHELILADSCRSPLR